MRREITREANWRRYHQTLPTRADYLSSWSAPSGALRDPATPQELRDALTVQRARLAQRIEHAGRDAIKHAPWARDLHKPSTMTDAQWHTMIGEVATYRATHKVSQDVPLADTANTGAPDEKPIHNIVTYLTMRGSDKQAGYERAQHDTHTTGYTVTELRAGRGLEHQPDTTLPTRTRPDGAPTPTPTRKPGLHM